mmetsp:Transcript_2430/g.7241  ORF Transcript_2430/g.7241 Transcript_2430/m.7241 type:complete len:345 (+) Transcript_2430:151-1185(+)
MLTRAKKEAAEARRNPALLEGLEDLSFVLTSSLKSFETSNLRAASTACRRLYVRNAPPNTVEFIYVESQTDPSDAFSTVVSEQPHSNLLSPLRCWRVELRSEEVVFVDGEVVKAARDGRIRHSILTVDRGWSFERAFALYSSARDGLECFVGTKKLARSEFVPGFFLSKEPSLISGRMMPVLAFDVEMYNSRTALYILRPASGAVCLFTKEDFHLFYERLDNPEGAESAWRSDHKHYAHNCVHGGKCPNKGECFSKRFAKRHFLRGDLVATKRNVGRAIAELQDSGIRERNVVRSIGVVRCTMEGGESFLAVSLGLVLHPQGANARIVVDVVEKLCPARSRRRV